MVDLHTTPCFYFTLTVCFTAQAVFAMEGENHAVINRHVPKLARPLTSRRHRLGSHSPASGETETWTGNNQTASPPSSITDSNPGGHVQSYHVHSPVPAQHFKTNMFTSLLHHASSEPLTSQPLISTLVSGNEMVRRLTSPANVHVESSPKPSPGVTEHNKTHPVKTISSLLQNVYSAPLISKPSTSLPIFGNETIHKLTSTANVHLESSEQSHVPTEDYKTRPLKTFTSLLHSASSGPVVSQSSTPSLISGNEVIHQLTSLSNVESYPEYSHVPTQNNKTNQENINQSNKTNEENTNQSNKAKQDDKPHPLKTFPALLLLVVIVTLVGLVHFKVCTEVKKCWKSAGLSDTWRSACSAVSHKLKLMLMPRPCTQNSDKGFHESSTTSLLTHANCQDV